MNNEILKESVEFIKSLNVEGDNIELAAGLITSAKGSDDFSENELGVLFALINNFIHSLTVTGDMICASASVMVKCRGEYERLVPDEEK